MSAASPLLRFGAIAAATALTLGGGALVSQAAVQPDGITVSQAVPGAPSPEKPGNPATDAFFEVNDANFEQLVVEQSKKELLMVDVYNEHCFTCDLLFRDLKQMMATTYKGKFRVAHIWNMKNPETAKKWNFTGVPILMAIRDGKDLGRLHAYNGMQKPLVEFLAKTVPAGQ